MTPESQRIAIAEYCGWKTNKEMLVCAVVNPFQAPDGSWHKAYPDYLNNLNAMHEAEKVLQNRCKYWPDYIDELCKMFVFDDVFACSAKVNWSQMVHATASQRAEAFLKTIGKWVE